MNFNFFSFVFSAGWAYFFIPDLLTREIVDIRNTFQRNQANRIEEQCLPFCESIAMIADRIFDEKCDQSVNSSANIVNGDFRNHTI